MALVETCSLNWLGYADDLLHGSSYCFMNARRLHVSKSRSGPHPRRNWCAVKGPGSKGFRIIPISWPTSVPISYAASYNYFKKATPIVKHFFLLKRNLKSSSVHSGEHEPKTWLANYNPTNFSNLDIYRCAFKCFFIKCGEIACLL